MATRTIGALWVRKSKGGVNYMSGVIHDLSGDIQIAIFKNGKKEKENQPDYQIVLSEKQEKKERTDDMVTSFFEQEAKDNQVISEKLDSRGEDDTEIDASKIPF